MDEVLDAQPPQPDSFGKFPHRDNRGATLCRRAYKTVSLPIILVAIHREDTATAVLAVGVSVFGHEIVFFELWAIAYIRARYMDTPFLQAVFQIVLGGVIVLGVGILIGAA